MKNFWFTLYQIFLNFYVTVLIEFSKILILLGKSPTNHKIFAEHLLTYKVLYFVTFQQLVAQTIYIGLSFVLIPKIFIIYYVLFGITPKKEIHEYLTPMNIRSQRIVLFGRKWNCKSRYFWRNYQLIPVEIVDPVQISSSNFWLWLTNFT